MKTMWSLPREFLIHMETDIDKLAKYVSTEYIVSEPTWKTIKNADEQF